MGVLDTPNVALFLKGPASFAVEDESKSLFLMPVFSTSVPMLENSSESF